MANTDTSLQELPIVLRAVSLSIHPSIVSNSFILSEQVSRGLFRGIAPHRLPYIFIIAGYVARYIPCFTSSSTEFLFIERRDWGFYLPILEGEIDEYDDVKDDENERKAFIDRRLSYLSKVDDVSTLALLLLALAHYSSMPGDVSNGRTQ